MSFTIALDGPAGAGKSTIAKELARRLSFVYVDTGAMYRALAYLVLISGEDPQDEEAVRDVLSGASVTISYQNGKQCVFLDGRDVTEFLRSEDVGNAASVISQYPDVRSKLLDLQRELAASKDVIMDGRDIGTTVLPHADVKIYLTAAVSTRAKRRYDELTARGQTCDLALIEEDIRERDLRDKNRKVSPLRMAEDAHLVDSSDLSVDEVCDAIIAIVRSKRS